MQTTTILWSAAQACGECGTDAAFVRDNIGAAVCRTCGHEHPMDSWNLDSGEVFEWRRLDASALSVVLHVTHYVTEED